MDIAVYGPPEARISWHEDSEPIECGDIPEAEMYALAQQYGVYGCVVELRPPACPCCGAKSWEHVASLWGIIGDADYHRHIERELTDEAAGWWKCSR